MGVQQVRMTLVMTANEQIQLQELVERLDVGRSGAIHPAIRHTLRSLQLGEPIHLAMPRHEEGM
ncbi:MAG: hypothetical protein LBJ87_14925 [bacterium]|jgi:hypothetical protein|nr:hypothetical protein [bacterium]